MVKANLSVALQIIIWHAWKLFNLISENQTLYFLLNAEKDEFILKCFSLRNYECNNGFLVSGLNK